MDRKEFAKLVLAMESAWNMSISGDEVKMNIWYDMLSDMSYDLAVAAIKKLMSQLKFAPTISEIRQAASEIIQGPALTAGDAWGEVTDAIRRYGIYREEEALENLSELPKRVVKSIGWRHICTSEEPDVVRGQFRMMYEQMAARHKEQSVLPAALSQQIGKLMGGKVLLEGGGKE